MRIKAHDQAFLNLRQECAENGIEAPVADIDRKRRIADYIEACIIAAKVENSTQLARKAGLAPSTLNKFMKNPDKARHLPSTTTLTRIGEVAGIDYTPALGEHARLKSDTPITRAPKVTWEQAAMLVNPSKTLSYKPGMDSVPVDSDSETLIAIEMLDNSMDRIVPKGGTVIVDYSDKVLRPGQPYAIKLKSKLCVRIYRERPTRLEAHSYEIGHPTDFLTGKIDVIGRVIQSVSPTTTY
jgi:transcriptional regulator with XRE-family HTH domain